AVWHCWLVQQWMPGTYFALLARLALKEGYLLRTAGQASSGTCGSAVSLVGIACLLATLAGCTRAHYRQQADRDAYYLTDEKLMAAGDAPGECRIDIDPRSRMYSPYNPDRPPMPPDDPTSHRYMEVVDGMRNAPQ